MSNQSYINPVFLIDPLNSKCIDCKKEDSAYISINNGVLVCANCAKKHVTLGYQISYLHDLKNELDTYLYKFIELGGNTRFKDYCASVEITDSTDFEVKYKCAAVDYYRRNLKCKVLNLGELVKDFQNPLLVLESNRKCFDEFETYISVKRLDGLRATINSGNKVGGWFKKIGLNIASGAKTAGNFIADKAIIAKNGIVEGAGKAKEGIQKTLTKKEKTEEKTEEKKENTA